MVTIKVCDVCHNELTSSATVINLRKPMDVCWSCFNEISSFVAKLSTDKKDQRNRLLAGKPAIKTQEEIEEEARAAEKLRQSVEDARRKRMEPYLKHISKLPPTEIVKLARNLTPKSSLQDLLYRCPVTMDYRLAIKHTTNIKMPHVPLTRVTEYIHFTIDVQGDENVSIHFNDNKEGCLLPEFILCTGLAQGTSIIVIKAIDNNDVIPLRITVRV